MVDLSESKEIAMPERLPEELKAQMLQAESSLFLNVAKFEHAQRVSNLLANSTMVPDHFRNSVGDCMIALNLADRFRADVFMIMQSLYVIHGKPGLEGKLVASLINQSGKYAEPLRYEFFSAQDKDRSDEFDPSRTDDGYGCRAIAVDKASGKTVRGPHITWSIVKAEGWYGKSGSKWKTMPELMFMYRSASWFANVHCPEVKLGMATVEELKDVVELERAPDGSFATPSATVEDLEKRILKEDDAPTDYPKITSILPAEAKPKWYERQNWVHKKTTGFTKFCENHQYDWSDVPAPVLDEIKTKWENLHDRIPFPEAHIPHEVVSEGNGQGQVEKTVPYPSDLDVPPDTEDNTGETTGDDEDLKPAVLDAILRSGFTTEQVSLAIKDVGLNVNVNGIGALSLDALERLRDRLIDNHLSE